MIHWGLYSLLGGRWKGKSMRYIGEWAMSRFRIPISEYEDLARQFSPMEFDADEWCRVAKQAGMKYIIFTAKHHDGFAMFHSKVDRFNVVDATPFGRDPVAELAMACQRHGLLLGLYYSQSLDWHDVDAGGFEPGLGTNHENMSWCNDWDFPDHKEKVFARYLECKVKPQLRELLTQYGSISHLWFDCPFTITSEQSSELFALSKRLQPGILINSRLGNGLGDFNSLGDNMIPGMKLNGAWEAVGTMNDTWGYKHDDQNWKKASDIVELLTGLSGKGINYLLNVGPDGNGSLPEGSVKVLNEVAEWMRCHSSSIYGTSRSPFESDFGWGPVTLKDNKLYLHIHRWPPRGRLMLAGLLTGALDARFLHDLEVALPFEQVLLNGRCLGLMISLPAKAFEMKAPVIIVTLEGEPKIAKEILQQPDGHITLPASLSQIHLGQSRESQQGAILSATDRFEPDGSKVSKSDGLRISTLGSTSNWWSPGDWLSWNFEVLLPGDYRLQIISTGLYHDQPWQGGHTVQVVVGGAELTAVLEMDKAIDNVASLHYVHAISDIGSLSLEKGVQELVLTAVHIVPNEIGLAIVSVEIVPK